MTAAAVMVAGEERAVLGRVAVGLAMAGEGMGAASCKQKQGDGSDQVLHSRINAVLLHHAKKAAGC